MSNFRTNFYLLIAIAAVAFANFVVDDMRLDSGSGAGGGETFCSLAGESSLSEITLSGACGAVKIVRDGAWRIVEPFESAADDRAVNRLVDALAAAAPSDSLSGSDLQKIRDPDGVFGFASTNAVGVSLRTKDGRTEMLRFGALVPTGGGVYAAKSGVEAVFVVPADTAAAAAPDADGLRDRRLFAIQPESVTALDVKRADGSLSRIARDDGVWKMSRPETAEVSAERMKRLLQGVFAASAVDFVWPVGASNEVGVASAAMLAAYGLGADSEIALSFSLRDGSAAQVAFGRDAGGGLVYALAHNGGAIVTVDASLLDFVRDRTGRLADSLVFHYDPKKVASLALADGQTAYRLGKDERGVWKLDSPVSAPADQETVLALIDRLLALKNPDRDDSGVVVSFTTNRPGVAVSRQAALGRIRPEDLRSLEIIDFAAKDIRRLVVSRAGDDKPSAVVYDGETSLWRVESAPRGGGAVQRAVDDIVAAISPLKAAKVERLAVDGASLRQYGLDKPFLTVAVDTMRDNAMRRNILIGSRTDGGYFATLGSADAVFVVPDETVLKLAADIVADQ
ncbi:MAG: DUF4340 domain-containing protein [Kiritimatiellae bacterium]|nr:DUF4340 domain-containing protein [Kiritimatiellia bacterium]